MTEDQTDEVLRLLRAIADTLQRIATPQPVTRVIPLDTKWDINSGTI